VEMKENNGPTLSYSREGDHKKNGLLKHYLAVEPLCFLQTVSCHEIDSWLGYGSLKSIYETTPSDRIFY